MLTDEVFIRKILAAVKEPEMIQPWNKSFTINATVFYVPEPYTPEMLLETCTQIRFLTLQNLWSTSYFLVVFPNASTVLLFSPQRALRSSMGQGAFPPALVMARHRITETAVSLTKVYCYERSE
jgi:hypothetical protein